MRWQTLSSTYLIENPWLTVRKDSCKLSNGKQIDDYFVLEYTDWCNVLALTPEMDVVLTKQYRHGLGQIGLELPGGMVDETGESAALKAIQRELLEETGYGGGQFTHLAALSPNPAIQTNLTHSFIAENVELIGAQELESTEDIEVVLKPLHDVIQLAVTGKLMQSMHVSTLFLALAHLGRVSTIDLKP